MMHNILQQRSAKFDKTRYTNMCIDRHHARTMKVLEKQRRHAMMLIMRETTDIKLEFQSQKRAKLTPKLPARLESRLGTVPRPTYRYTGSIDEPVTDNRRATPSTNEGEEDVEMKDRPSTEKRQFFRTQLEDIASDNEKEEGEEDDRGDDLSSVSDNDKMIVKRPQNGVAKTLPKRTRKKEATAIQENDPQKLVEETIRKLRLQYPKLSATFSVAIPTEDATNALAVRRYKKLRRQSLDQINASMIDKPRRNSSAPPHVRKQVIAPTAPGDASWKVVEITPLEQLGGRQSFRLPSLVTEDEEKLVDEKWAKLSKVARRKKLRKTEYDKLMFIHKYEQTKENEQVMEKLEQYMSKTKPKETVESMETSDDDMVYKFDNEHDGAMTYGNGDENTVQNGDDHMEY